MCEMSKTENIMRKLQSNRGVSVLLSLLFLLLCSVLGMLGLGLAELYADRSLTEDRKDQETLILMSAAQVIEERLEACCGQWESELIGELDGCSAELIKSLEDFAKSDGLDEEWLGVQLKADMEEEHTRSIPTVRLELLIERDAKQEAEYQNAEKTILWIPVCLNGTFQVQRDSKFVNGMKLYSAGAIIYDKENSSLDVTLDQIVFKDN